MFNQNGVTIIEALIATSLGILITAGGVKAINHYAEETDLENRSLSTADQMIAFAEASYKLTSGVGGLDTDTITITRLKDNKLLDNSFPDETPYGQEIKGFLIENPDNSALLDLMVSTTGSMNDAYIERSGQSGDSINRIQEQVYLDMRRHTLNLGVAVDQKYYFGMVENNTFSTNGNLYARDVSSFTTELNTHEMQPSILLTTPNQQAELIPQLQAIQASRIDDIPANNSATSVITVSVRNNDGTPVKDANVLWNSTRGSLSDSTTITNEKGLATTSIKSGEVSTIKVTARVNSTGSNKSVDIRFVAPEIASLSATPSNNVNADGVMCSNLLANLAYPDGTKASNESISWITNKGSFKTQSIKTDNTGNVTACLTSSEEATANARVKVSRSGVIESTSIQFIGARINNGAMWASPSSGIPANGSDYSRITIRATYPDGKRASGIKINWSTNRGSLNASQTTTNANGETSIVVRSNQAGNATITARVPTGQARSVTVGFDAARIVNIYANKTSNIPADNSSTATISVVLQYPNGKRATNEIVNWSASRSGLSHGSTRTNGSGIASNYIKSGSAGTTTVRASYGGTTRTINISFKEDRHCNPSDEKLYMFSTGPGEYDYGFVKTLPQGYYVYCKPGNFCYTLTNVYVCSPDGSKWISDGLINSRFKLTSDMNKVRNQPSVPVIPKSSIKHYYCPISCVVENSK